MKKIMKLLAAAGCVVALASCSTTTPVAATSNPVGNKCGVAKTTVVLGFGGNADCGINKAAKDGGITRISHVDQFQKNYLVFTVYGVRVYGE